MTQGGIQNYAQSLQSGDNNEHTVTQDGYLNYASLASYGDNNRISVSTLPNTLPMGNSVDAIQVGNANTAVVEQSGTGAYIRTRQEGSGNTVEALQRNESDSLAPDALSPYTAVITDLLSIRMAHPVWRLTWMGTPIA
ncbi:curlin repeat-containing protein [Pseudomonas luteola]|uniref:curlin repeat-containing protein n=1 Tax=Pseudomonas luteola TaxID=47886 RepID=UPI003CC71DC6